MTRFTSESELRAELLTQTIAASTGAVDPKRITPSTTPPSASQLASAMIERALRRGSHSWDGSPDRRGA